jgi:iron complex outermembrane receptor protein
MNNTKSFHKKLMPLMISLIAAGGSSVVVAQDDAVEEIVVSGFRESLSKALDIKRESTTQVDAIVAEDIGKFPDMNLAESLQRVSGISIDRDGGEGRQISVRGLGSDFTRVRLNGMEALSTSGQGSNGPNRSRGFDFNTFASELFSEVKVNKTQAASMDEGSLGSTVDLRASRPFDFKGFKLMGSAQGSYNDLTDKTSPRLSGMISNTTEDGMFGALASFSYSERSILEEGFNPVRFDWGNGFGTSGNRNGYFTGGGTAPTATSNPYYQYGFCTPVGYSGPQVPRNPLSNEGKTSTTNNSYGGFGIDANNCSTGNPRPANTAANIAAYETATESWHPRYPGWRRQAYDLNRLGITTSFQFQPADTTLFNLDILYSKYEKDQREDTLGINLHRAVNLGGKSEIVVRQAEKDALNRLTYAVFDNVDLRTESAMFEENTEFAQYSLSMSHDIGDATHIDAQIGTSTSKYARPINSLITLDNTNLDGVTWDARESFKTPKMSYGIDLTDAANWKWLGYGAVPVNTNGSGKGVNISEIRLNPMYVDNSFDTSRIDLTHEFNDIFTFSAGVAFKDYTMESQEFRHISYGLLPEALPAGTSVADISTVLTGFGDGLGNGAAPSSWLVPDFEKVAEILNIYSNTNKGTQGGNYTLASVGHFGASGNNYVVEEESQSAYLQVDFKTEFLGKDLRGNIGSRFVETDIASTGWVPCPQVGASTSAPGFKAAGDNKCARSTEFLGIASATATPGSRYYLPIEASHSYTDVLPALNLAWSVRDDLVVRFAAAKTMARPSLVALSPTVSGIPTTFTNDDALYSINAGNPTVDPYRSTNYDLSAEWYFDEGSLLSAAVFHKDIKSYIQRVRQVVPWTETGWSTDLLPAGFDGNESFSIQSYFNTPGGSLDGFEIGYEQQFTFLPGFWKNFGVKTNYTHVSSELDYVQSSTVNSTTREVTTTYTRNNLVNMSPSSYNGTVYYDDGKFSARISIANRDAYLTDILVPESGFDLDGNSIYTADVQGKQATTQVDFNLSYEWDTSLTLTFAAINLTDQFDDKYGDSTLQYPLKYSHTGREYNVGVRYKF